MVNHVALSLAFVAACSTGNTAPDRAALGDETFRNTCARCHGETGKGGLPMTPDGTKPRDFTDPAWQASRTDVDIEYIVRHGKAPMPAFKDVLTPDQITAVVAKVRRLKAAPQ